MNDLQTSSSAPAWFERFGGIIRTLLLALIAIMGFALRAELTKFAAEKLQPLADRMVQESYERRLEVQELRLTTQQLSERVRDLTEAMKSMQHKMESIYDETVPKRR